HLFASIDFIISYFTIAWRAMKTHKSYSLINILGLSIGLAATIVIIRYVVDEITYDSFHSKADKIFRINYSYDTRGETTTVAKTAFPLKPYLLENYPEITQIVRFYKNTQNLTTLSYKDKIYTEENVMFSDPNVFEVFDFKLTKGDPNTALSSANSIVLTQQAASKYFGSEDPMGKVIKFQNEDKLVISGVLEEIPGNSHLKFDILLPIELQRQRWMRVSENNGYDLEKDWKWSGSWSYLYIENPENLQAVKQRLYEEGADFFGRLTNSKITYLYDLQNLRDIHLGMTMAGAVEATGNKFEVYGFLVIAMLILFIACINFINLSTARSVQRAKEVGLRKVFGAFRKQLIHQFITESILITLISACVGLFILELLLPYFNDFTNKALTIPYGEYPQIILIIFLGVLLVGVLAGLYPSIYLSRFQPVRALKGNKEPYIHGFGMRKLLVLTQFIVTNVLIISILIIKSQLSFIKGKDLGFDKEQIIVLKHGRKLSDEFHQLKEQLLNHSLIANVDRGYVAGKRGWTQSFRINGEDRTESKGMGIKHVSYDFLDMYNLKLIAGRNFDRKHSTDSTSAILINEATLRILGWDAHEALGQTFSWIGGSDNRTRYEVKVIGILADANFESLYEQVRPSVFKLDNFGEIAIKLAIENKEQLKAAIEVVESAWNNVSPEW
ncbi:MAG: ABC transporter permease, partial [Marinoscillum sp.]